MFTESNLVIHRPQRNKSRPNPTKLWLLCIPHSLLMSFSRQTTRTCKVMNGGSLSLTPSLTCPPTHLPTYPSQFSSHRANGNTESSSSLGIKVCCR